LFEGKKPLLLRTLKKDMMRAAKAQEFEVAQKIKRKIFALTHIQDVSLIKEQDRSHKDDRSVRFEAYDVAHTGGTAMVGVMTVVEGGDMQKDSYRKFALKTVSGSNDPAALAEILERRLGHPEWSLPHCIVVDGGVIQKRRAESVLRAHGIHIPVVAVVKDEHHRPKKILGPDTFITKYERDILLANAEAHRFAVRYHRTLRDTLKKSK
jgi:excinuclease ABC subunit C